MKSKPALKKKHLTIDFVLFAIALPGFIVLLLFSLIAYQIESRYLRAFETKIASQDGRIYELEKLLKDKELSLSECQ